MSEKTSPSSSVPPTRHKRLLEWVETWIKRLKPDAVHWCDGSEEEYDALCEQMVVAGTFLKLNPEKRPNSFLARSDASDVARVEDRTYICSTHKGSAGPTNNWMEPREMKKILTPLFEGCMKGRTLYIVPFSMGPIGSPIAHIGVQLTDSPYVAVNMRIMTRMGQKVLDYLGDDGDFVKCLHSVGAPLAPGQADVSWPCNEKEKYIVHFPGEQSIWSYGSGYGGNALLGKKCFALRIASVLARNEGWLAEHMLILGVTNPQGEKDLRLGGVSERVRQDELRDADSPGRLPERRLEDQHGGRRHRLDQTWPRRKDLRDQPGGGLLRGRAGDEREVQPQCDGVDHKEHDLHQRRADRRWRCLVGGDDRRTPPAHLIDWTGQDWTPDCGRKAAHPNARFTALRQPVPVHRPGLRRPGGRPDLRVHLRRSSLRHGSARLPDLQLELRRLRGGDDGLAKPRRRQRARSAKSAATRWRCCRSAATTWPTTSRTGSTSDARFPNPPRIYCVNWFGKGADGKFLWPGFGENMRVLEWVVNRSHGRAFGVESPIGWMPRYEDLDWRGLNLTETEFEHLMHIDRERWQQEIASHDELFVRLYDRLPKEFLFLKELTLSALWRTPERGKLEGERPA